MPVLARTSPVLPHLCSARALAIAASTSAAEANSLVAIGARSCAIAGDASRRAAASRNILVIMTSSRNWLCSSLHSRLRYVQGGADELALHITVPVGDARRHHDAIALGQLLHQATLDGGAVDGGARILGIHPRSAGYEGATAGQDLDQLHLMLVDAGRGVAGAIVDLPGKGTHIGDDLH